jgi:hypothetical protein
MARRARALPSLLVTALAVSISGCSSALPTEPRLIQLFPPATLHGRANLPTALNIVILGDGFTADMLPAYRAAADAFTAELLASAPFGGMLDSFNVVRVDLLSAEAGIDVPDRCGSYSYANPPHPSLRPWARTPRQRDTALGTTWCTFPASPLPHLITSSDESLVMDAALLSGVIPHAIVVLVNDWMYGATAWPNKMVDLNDNGGIAYVSIGQNLTGEINPLTNEVLQPNGSFAASDVAVHELGHLGPFALLDEYGGSSPPIPQGVQDEIDASPNLTSSLSPLKWEALKTPNTQLPTNCSQEPVPDAGAVPGGATYSSGVFHAHCACRMKAINIKSFCIVCREQVLRGLMDYAPPLPAAWKMRVLTDSVTITTGPNGHFFIRAMASGAGTTSNWRWPTTSANQLLEVGRTFAGGGVLLNVNGSEPLPKLIQYDLMRSTRPEVALATLVEQRSIPILSPPRLGAHIERFQFSTHRITLAFLIR